MAVFVKYNGNNNNNNNNNNTINGSLNLNSTSSLRTYKRRKTSSNGDSSSSPKSTVVVQHSSHIYINFEDKMVSGLADIVLRNTTCEQICNGSDDDCGVGGDVPNNLSSINTNPTQKNWEPHDGPCDHERIRISSNGFPSQLGHPTVLETCEQIFIRIITSEKFVALCESIMKNFPGIEVEELLGFSRITSRIERGVYQHTPSLFSKDIQLIWRKLHSIGGEMIILSQNLSQLSKDAFHELLSTWYSVMQKNKEEWTASIFRTCRQCGKLSDGSDCLVCDSCEEMFHLSCIHPTIKEIPHKSWYCSKCNLNDVISSHRDCPVCERLIDTVPPREGTVQSKPHCKMCGCMVNNGEEFRVCEHSFCRYKHYHTRCLSNKQCKSYGPRWYCPSCLCRVCLSDKDDDDLVMCDGCDYGYHIYCMTPPRSSVPKGKWYCSQCDGDLQAIRKAKKLYVKHERKKNKGKRNNSICSNKVVEVKEEVVDGSKGMDMLLTAAKTLKKEESTL